LRYTPAALEAFRAAVAAQQRLPPRSAAAKHTYVKVEMAVCLTHLGHHEEAESLLREAADVDDDAITRKDLGDVLVRQGRLREAVAEYRRALKEDPEWLGAYAVLAMCLRRLRRAPAAGAVVEKGRRKVKDIDLDLGELAALESAARDKSAALRYLAAAVSSDPPVAALLRSELEFDWLWKEKRFRDLVGSPERRQSGGVGSACASFDRVNRGDRAQPGPDC
jgi:tetratricopeptide (TPR) repeat protein